MITGLPSDIGVVAASAVTTIGLVTKAVIALGKANMREKSLTARFKKALEDTTPPQRPEIIRAMNSLEASRGDSDIEQGSLAHPNKISVPNWVREVLTISKRTK